MSYSGLPRQPEGAEPTNTVPPGGGHINDRVAPPPAFQQQLSDEQTATEPDETGLNETGLSLDETSVERDATGLGADESSLGPDVRTKRPLSAAMEKMSEMQVTNDAETNSTAANQETEEQKEESMNGQQKGSKRNHSDSSEVNRPDSDSDMDLGEEGGPNEENTHTEETGPSASTVDATRSRPNLPRRSKLPISEFTQDYW